MVLALHVDITGADRPSGDGCSFCCKAILRQPWLLLLDFIGLIHPRMAAVVVVDVSSIHSIRQIQIQVSRSKDHLHHLFIVDKDVSILDSPLLNHYNSCFLRSAERCNISSKLRKALRSRGDASFLPEVTHSTDNSASKISFAIRVFLPNDIFSPKEHRILAKKIKFDIETLQHRIQYAWC